jgi:hypothetical protein
LITELYKFVEGSNVWTLTSSNVAESYLGDNYDPCKGLGRTEGQVKTSLERANIEVKMPLSHELAMRNVRAVNEETVTLTVFSNENGDYATEWKGRLVQVKPGKGEAILIFETIFTSLRRHGLGDKATRNCNRQHYGPLCRLLYELWAIAATCGVVNGSTVTVADAALQPDGWYNGGIIEGPDGSMRFIVSHVGTTLTLIRPLDSLANGVAIKIAPGCDRTKEICKTKFNNIANHGGLSYQTTKNPVGGAPVA